MKKLLASLLCVVAIAFVALTPSKASAGWGWWGGPGISIYVGPRYGYPYYGYYGYRPYGYYGYYGYRPYGYYGYRPYRYYGYRHYRYGHWARHAYRRWH
jgi:hypothetical protein